MSKRKGSVVFWLIVALIAAALAGCYYLKQDSEPKTAPVEKAVEKTVEKPAEKPAEPARETPEPVVEPEKPAEPAPAEAVAPVETVKINFPTASASGALYAVGAAITNMWSNKVPGVAAASQSSAGGIANLNMIAEGEAQISIAISSNCWQALNGTDSFEGAAYPDLKAIAGLYLNPNQVVATKASGIETLADVKGKHFAVASAGSSVYNECDAHFTAAGLKFPDDLNAEYITFTDAADMLQNGTIDGAWIMSGTPAGAVTQAAASGCKLVDINEDIVKALQEKFPWYVTYTIPAGTYPNQDKDVQTTAIKMVMFCRGDLDENLVYQLTKAFWENIDELGEAQKNLKGLTAAEAVVGISNVPLHSGAERYYTEIGVLK